MLVVSDRVYSLDATPNSCWQAITSVQDYQRWWPWLTRFEGSALEPGCDLVCSVQAPVPYRLDFVVSIDTVRVGQFVSARVSGDIKGDASIELAATDEGCTVHLRSRLGPANPVLNAVAMVAEPIVRLGHDWVLDTGARQFSRHALASEPAPWSAP